MALLFEIRRRLRGMALPLVFACVTVYFGYHAIHGSRGLLSLFAFEEEIARAHDTLAETGRRQAELSARVALMRPESLDPDMLEEQARRTLNLARPGDVSILNSSIERMGSISPRQ